MTTSPPPFICVEGPSGVGKTTLVTALVAEFRRTGTAATPTKGPTSGPLGQLTRQQTDSIGPLSLACLVAADRYHQLATEIEPALAAGSVVVCDRYLPSSLVLQGADGVPAAWLHLLHQYARTPDAYVFLVGDPRTVRSRAMLRPERDRFHQQLTGEQEARRFRAAAREMGESGVPVCEFDVAVSSPDQVLRQVLAWLTSVLGDRV
jgi:dTMP kinase